MRSGENLLSLLSIFIAAWPAWGQLKTVEYCQGEGATKKVLLIKQWHLSPTTVTKGFKEKYPQQKNQAAIYTYLNKLVKEKKLQLVLGEGCEGEIDENFIESFNGWALKTLKKQAQSKNFANVLTHVPLKLEARHGSKLLTLCGDDLKLIQEGNLRLSNLRGWQGFREKLRESEITEERLKLYRETAVTLLKVKPEISLTELLLRINDEMKKDLATFVKSLNERNESMIKALKDRDFKTAAIVIGGLHADDLKVKLESGGFACDVLEPPGYPNEDEKLIQSFESAL